ncbi:MAG TPA: twin-arginine translocase subunit TatC [Patescibacteria group bacterium]|nr:twin-arginine translocase subunit TatC [Patescibacteria group bacterium]
MSPELKAIVEKYSPFLKEARKRVVTAFVIFLISMFAGFVFYEQIIKFLLGFLSLRGVNIVFTSPFQFINLAISCGVATGVIVVFPILVYQILSFLKPALSPKEYKVIVGFIPFSLCLFLVGFTFGTLIMKWQIEIFLARSVSLGIGNVLDISSLLSVVLLTSAFLGLGFQFPIVLLLLLKLRVINHKGLTSVRKWVYLGSFMFALLLPPDSILADVILSLPLIALYEVTLLIDRVFIKRNRYPFS